MSDSNKLNGFMQWQEMFDESVSKQWKEESFPNLKNISMLLFCLTREIRKIYYESYSEILDLRKRISDNSSSDGCSVDSHLCDEKNNSCQANSPEIKKKYRPHNFRKNLRKKLKLNINPSQENSLDITAASDGSFMKNIKEIKGSIIENDIPNICLEMKESNQMVHTPKICQETESDSDHSIVQCTPVSSSTSKISFKQLTGPTFILQNRNLQGNTSYNPMTSSKSCKLKLNQKLGSMDSVMDITNMVSYINKETISEVKNNELNSNRDEIVICTPEPADDDTPLNNARFEESYSTVEAENTCTNMNVPLAEVGSVSIQLEARQKLPKESCKDCERFYQKQCVDPRQIGTLAKCFKHKGFYKPREDTLPGYWNMDVSLDGTENT